MKVLKLPFLALTHLLQIMMLPDIFILSMCSQRMKRIIKNMKLKVSKVKFVFEETKLIIWIETTDGKQYPIISTETIPHFIEDGGSHHFQIGDVKVDHFLENIHSNPYHLNIVYSKELENSFEKALVDHASTMFKNSPALQLQTNLHRKLPIMTGIQDIHFIGKYYQGVENDMESFLSIHSNLKSIHLDFKPRDFEYHDKLLRIPNLCGCRTNFRGSNILEYFKGRVGIFRNAICDSKLLRVFLRKWIKYRLYENLKVLQIDLDPFSNELIPLDILGNYRRKEWDPNQRPQYFEYELHRIMGYEKQTIVEDCSTWIDIEREQDKKLVSVKIEPKRFYFYVWN